MNENFWLKVLSLLHPFALSSISKKFHALSLQAFEDIDSDKLSIDIIGQILKNPKIKSLRLAFLAENPFPENLEFSTLETLKLEGCMWVDDGFLKKIPHLKIKNLSLYWSVKITDDGVQDFLKKCPNLEILSLSGVSHITDESIIALTNKDCLKELDLTRVPQVTDRGLNLIAKQFGSSLEKLILYANTYQITENFYDTGLSMFTALTDIDLCGHLKLNDEQMSKLIHNCPNISTINLSWCLGIGEQTMTALTTCKHLSWLSLFGLKTLSKDSIYKLIEARGKNMRGLDIRGIPSVKELTEDDCRTLRELLPKLKSWRLHS